MADAQVVYDGPYDAVEIPAANNLVAEKGTPVTVPADVARSLLEQDCWKPAPGRASKAQSTPKDGE